mmetsp:Transcript_13032/g.28226  ORF Transcript_13032/g.28226 Transcript_13032/m.28226 type:complete len:119 (-) Transcript_13032:7-363(-)
MRSPMALQLCSLGMQLSEPSHLYGGPKRKLRVLSTLGLACCARRLLWMKRLFLSCGVSVRVRFPLVCVHKWWESKWVCPSDPRRPRDCVLQQPIRALFFSCGVQVFGGHGGVTGAACA